MTKKKVLVIDDDPLIRETVKATLVHAGFETSTLESPALAQTVVKKSKPDLIVMDLYMPDHNGLDLCRSLNGDPETRGIPVVIFTGSTERIDVVAGIQAGAVEYLAKPVEPQTLVNKIKQILKLPK